MARRWLVAIDENGFVLVYGAKCVIRLTLLCLEDIPVPIKQQLGQKLG